VLRHDRLHHAGIADIEARRGRANLSGKTECSFDIDITDHDVSAGIGKAPHDCRTNALRAPRDEGTSAVEPPESAGASGRHD
jgi:hypothetical protein